MIPPGPWEKLPGKLSPLSRWDLDAVAGPHPELPSEALDGDVLSSVQWKEDVSSGTYHPRQ